MQLCEEIMLYDMDKGSRAGSADGAGAERANVARGNYRPVHGATEETGRKIRKREPELPRKPTEPNLNFPSTERLYFVILLLVASAQREKIKRKRLDRMFLKVDGWLVRKKKERWMLALPCMRSNEDLEKRLAREGEKGQVGGEGECVSGDWRFEMWFGRI